MKTTLVISDIHQKHIRAQSIIDSVECDKVVLTGDYFDNYGDTPEHARNTAIWLKENVLYNPKIVALLGNHDTSYIWNNNPNFPCSGYSSTKSVAINEILTAEDKNRFKVFHIDQGYVFSHAGLSNLLWKEFLQKYPENTAGKPKLEYFAEVLSAFVADAINDANRGHSTQLFGCGWDRHGHFRNGGINWVDWNNLAPIVGINQIVGHSAHRVPHILVQRDGGGYTRRSILEYYEHEDLVRRTNEALVGPIKQKKILSTSYNLDTGLGHYAVITDGVVDIYEYFNRLNLKDVKSSNIPDSSMNNLS